MYRVECCIIFLSGIKIFDEKNDEEIISEERWGRKSSSWQEGMVPGG